MAGTMTGGKKAAQTNKEKYGEDFYKIQGAKGGRNGRTGGFAWMKANGMDDKIRESGRKGGTISRKGVKNVQEA